MYFRIRLIQETNGFKKEKFYTWHNAEKDEDSTKCIDVFEAVDTFRYILSEIKDKFSKIKYETTLEEPDKLTDPDDHLIVRKVTYKYYGLLRDWDSISVELMAYNY